MGKQKKERPLARFAGLTPKVADEKPVDSSKKSFLSQGVRKALNGVKRTAIDKISQSTNEQLSKIPKNLRKHVDLDIKNKRIFLSNTFILEIAELFNISDI